MNLARTVECVLDADSLMRGGRERNAHEIAFVKLAIECETYCQTRL